MINILGRQRIIILSVLIAVNVAVGMLVYLYLFPQQMFRQQELAELQGKISTLQTDVNRMQLEFDQLEEKQAQFDSLKERGFFYNQDRRRAEVVLQTIQKQAGVISAIASIQPGIVEENADAQKADYKILKSSVRVHIEALDSTDVYRYIYMLQHYFPGHLSVMNLDMERKTDITGALLREISTGKNPVLVQADIELAWRTMIPQSEVINTGRP